MSKIGFKFVCRYTFAPIMSMMHILWELYSCSLLEMHDLYQNINSDIIIIIFTFLMRKKKCNSCLI